MSKAAMKKLFSEFNYKYSLWDVFQDFLFISAAAISNRVDIINAPRREKEYLKIIKKYTPKEADLFAQLFVQLVITLEETPGDILGELFMEMELGSKWKGQFFTPFNLSLLTAQVSITDDIKEIVDKNGYITMNEPACGSGGMVIAFAQAMKERGLDPSRHLYAIVQDLDVKCTWMSYIQLSLLGIPAIVLHANTLTLEVFDKWRTPVYVLEGWAHRSLKGKTKEEVDIKENNQGQICFDI